jgi:hypothetical protein
VKILTSSRHNVEILIPYILLKGTYLLNVHIMNTNNFYRGWIMRKGIRKEDITCEIENPYMLCNNSNFSKMVAELFCKDLSNEDWEILISMMLELEKEEINPH